MNRNFKISVIILINLLFYCSASNGTGPAIEFSDIEVHYIKSGGWIITSKLDIYGDGLVKAQLIGHASAEPTETDSVILKEDDQQKMENMFSSFSNYDRHYEPDPWYTDGEYHLIIFTHGNKTDTVSVYGIWDTDIPTSLKEIIDKMERTWSSVLGYEMNCLN